MKNLSNSKLSKDSLVRLNDTTKSASCEPSKSEVIHLTKKIEKAPKQFSSKELNENNQQKDRVSIKSLLQLVKNLMPGKPLDVRKTELNESSSILGDDYNARLDEKNPSDYSMNSTESYRPKSLF